MECLEKEVKAVNAINTQAKIISSPKTTHVNNNTRVINNFVVDDSDQISIVPPVNESNKEVNYSLVNGPHQINIDHNTCNRNQRSGSLPEELHYSQESNQQQRIAVRITSIRKSKRARKKVNLRQLEVNDSSIAYRVGSYSSSQRRKQSSLSFKNKSHNNHRETNNEGFCTDLSIRDKIGWFNFYY